MHIKQTVFIWMFTVSQRKKRTILVNVTLYWAKNTLVTTYYSLKTYYKVKYKVYDSTQTVFVYKVR